MRFYQSITTQQFTLRITVEFIPGEKKNCPVKPKPEPSNPNQTTTIIINQGK